MPEIAEALQAAFDKVESQGAEIPQPVTETAPEPEVEKPAFDRPRDDLGRFSQHEPYKTERQSIEKAVEKAEKPEETQEPVVEAKQPPKSWKKDYHEHWSKLEPAIQEYVLQREDEYYRGVGTYKQNAEVGQQFMEAARPYEAVMRSLNVTPVQAFQALANADYTLRTADRATKAQLFAQLAQQYGVDLTDVQAPPIIDPTVAELQKTIQDLRNELYQVKNSWETVQTSTLQAQIEDAAKRLPHFEELRPTMAQVMNAGLANTLEEAYDKALRLNPELFDQVTAQQRQAEEQRRLQEAAQAAAKAKAAAVQVRGSPSTALPATRTDLRSVLESAWDQSIR